MYRIQGYASDFQTGHTADGRQVLLGLLCPNLVAYFFSPDGSLLGREVRPWEYPAPRQGANSPYAIYDPEFMRRLTAQQDGWRQEIGFAPGTIQVARFFDSDCFVGVEDLSDPDEDDEEEDTAQTRAMRAAGYFTFFWAKDYLLSASGRVEAT